MTGIFAHSMKLTRRAKAAYILNHFFPDGMKVGGDGQYEEYKQLLQTLFGDEQDSSQDHSIDAVIGDVGVLVGRGLYMGPERVQWDPAVISIVETFVETAHARLFHLQIYMRPFKKNWSSAVFITVTCCREPLITSAPSM